MSNDLTIAEPRRHLCKFYDGALTGTFTVTDLTTGRVIFSKLVTVEASRKAVFSSRAEVTGLLVDRAIAGWLAAFRAQGMLKPPRP